jgi:hypothetical protein
MISVDKVCYVKDEDTIIVYFEQCNLQQDDWWVGIYLEGADPQQLGEFDDVTWDWAWNCGSQDCGDFSSTHFLSFDTSDLGLSTFRVHLLQTDPAGPPYQSQAMSEPFVVSGSCGT